MSILTFKEFINEGKVNNMTPEEFGDYLSQNYVFKEEFTNHGTANGDIEIPYYRTVYKEDNWGYSKGDEHILKLNIEYVDGKPYDLTIDISNTAIGKNKRFLKIAEPLGIVEKNDDSFGIDRYLTTLTHRRIVKIIDAVIDVYGGPKCLIQKADVEFI